MPIMVRSVFSRCLILTLALATIALPVGYYRYIYAKEKRVRVVTEGKVYRCGQLTAAGFAEVFQRYGIKTLINLQDEDPDPNLGHGLSESEFCKHKGVRYHWLPPQLVPEGEPQTIEKFLEVCDDKNAYPILLHCKAGLHRTGTMVAFYRIEYEQWSRQEAIQELLTCGFSLKQCTAKNPYIKNYLLDYQPRYRKHQFADSSGNGPRGESAPRP
jgi:protein tyrosine/serine phosphatase